ncbi:MAG: hypothetical protein J6Z79_00840 [Clostridia bacterium]|nr:hypothetical protein [Clostridia bacterium]
MNSDYLEITEHKEPGFKPLVIYEGWRAAILNDDPSKYRRDTMAQFERHNLTDEVFVLLSGHCTLLIGDGKGDDSIGNVTPVPMEPQKLYNVRRGVWHNLLGEEGMVLFVVENSNTSRQTSDFIPIKRDQIP